MKMSGAVELKIELLKKSAEMEAKQALEGKSTDFVEGFHFGCEFMLDFMKGDLAIHFPLEEK